MEPRLRRRLAPIVGFVAAAVMLLGACSSGSDSSTSRSAAAASGVDTTGFSKPNGDAAKAINANDWCLRPQDADGDSGFRYVRNITVCQVMVNATKRFTSPGVLGEPATLGVVRADCSQNDFTCSDVGGSYKGEVRTEGASASNVTLKGDRYATPNPFLTKSAIQFMPKSIWSGVEVRTYVGANTAPFSLSQSQAQMYSYIPTNGSNSANCVSGEFIACTLVTPSSAYESGSNLQFEYRFTNRPVSIQIVNGTGRNLKIVGAPLGTAGSAFLVDPAAIKGIDAIAPGGSGYAGGYLGTSSDPSRYWRASYCVELPSSGCYQIDVSISLVEKDGQLTSDSKCTIATTDAVYAFRCEMLTPSGGDDGRFFTVNVKA